jgi:hypothetical protein
MPSSRMELFTVSIPAMYKRSLIFVAAVLLAGGLQAQEKKYVYQDTSSEQIIVAPVEEGVKEELITVPKEEDYSPVADNDRKADTSLRFKRLWVSEDTVRYWKKMPAFGYAAYLDSLLRNRQFEWEKAEKQRKERNSEDKSSSSESSGSSSSHIDSSPGFFNSPAVTAILWILAGGFVLFILYSLFLKDGVFRRNTKAAVNVSNENDAEEVKPGTNMDSMIAQAVKDKNYRLAVRYQYLKNLHKLAEKGLVQYAVDKTNYQYVHELTNAGLRNEFAGITLNYEYVWYGEFEIDETIYRKMETGFTTLYNKI